MRTSDEGMRCALRWLALATLLVCTSSCGFGTAGVVAAAGKSGRRTTTSLTTLSGTSVGGFLTEEPKVSPARIRFTLADEQSDPASVDLFYTLPSAPGQEVLMTALEGLTPTLATSPGGIDHTISWRFIEEAGIPSNGSLIEGVTLIARVRGGTSQLVNVRLGNDAPSVEVLPPAPEIAGVAPIRFRLVDSSDDAVDVRVEYELVAEPGVRRITRPAGLDPVLETPPLAFRGVAAPRAGDELVFFWDTDSSRGDLKDLERDVVLHFTVIDLAGAAGAAISARFRVDNNDAPIIQLGEGSLVANPDDRRGIPIPYTVIDDEGDPVRVLFQWRRQSEPGFPALGTTDPIELARLVEDPSFVREKHICMPFPAYSTGRAMHIDATHVRLPEVQQSESRLLANGGMEFRVLELLRPASVARLASTWSQNRLSRPTAALPLGDGITALVLDGIGSTSRLLEVDLATGAARTIAAGLAGLPTALAVDADEKRALVATDFGGEWQLFAVDLESGTPTSLITRGATGPVGPLRGLLLVGDKAALATAANSLWRLDWSGAGTIVRMRDNLATPWGLALDPLRPGHVLIAEREADRIVSFDVNTRAVEPVPASRKGGPAFEQPTSIATTRTGAQTRLIVLCNSATPTQREVFGLNLGSHQHTTYSLGQVPSDAATVATGVADLLVVALPLSTDLAVGGGIEQEREVVSFDPVTATATVANAFMPAVRAAQSWRISVGRSLLGPIRGIPGGTQGVFVWDSRQAGLRDGTLVKGTSMDTEFGSLAQSAIQRPIDQLDSLAIASTFRCNSVVAVDLDGDGGLDLVCTNRLSDQLTLLYQDAPRGFTAGTLAAGRGPESVAVGDLDGDGDLDLVCANNISDDLTVLFQEQPRTFGAQLTLRGVDSPSSVTTADLDHNGALDLVCTTFYGVTVFFQDAPGDFRVQPPLIAGSYPTSIVAADLDSDGALDLVCANRLDSNLSVFFQDRPRGFNAQVTLQTGSEPSSVAAADLDGDGALDLVCANRLSANLTLFFQDAPRSFTAQQPRLATGEGPASVAVADLNDDGVLDLVCANELSAGVSVFIQGRPRAFTAQPPLRPGIGAAPTSVAVADLDGDGVLDFACTKGLGGNLTVFFQDASRTFAPQPPLRVRDGPGAVALSVATVDLDGDGRLDLVCPNYDSLLRYTLTVFSQDAPRAFTAQLSLPTLEEPMSVAAADLDGDSYVDLVCANGPGLTVFFQDALRTFTAQPRLAAGGRPVSVAIADLDSDGALDLVCANRSSDNLTVFFQDASRVFRAQPSLVAGDGPVSVTAADLDRDGDLDVVCANEDSNNLTVFFQDAPRSFSARSLAAGGVGPASVAVADLDGDGDLDIVCANELSNDLTVFFQDAPRLFSARSLAAGGVGPASVAAADLDGDGDVDLVCANFSSNDLTTFFQDSPRVWIPY